MNQQQNRPHGFLGQLLEHHHAAEILIRSRIAASEVECSVKTPWRLPAILYWLARTYDGIWYFCPKALEEPLRQSFGQLDAGARRKFSLVLLPRERAGAAGQPSTPPPPTDDAPGRKGDR